MRGKGLTLSDFLKERKPDKEIIELRFEDGGGFSVMPETLYSMRNKDVMGREILSTEERGHLRKRIIRIALKGAWN